MELKINQKFVSFIKLVMKHFKMGNVSDSAIVLAYYALLSLFPILIMLGSIIKLLHGDPNDILTYIKTAVPSSIYTMLLPMIKSAFDNNNSGGSLSIGLLLVIWSASQAMAAFQRTVNRTYGVADDQNPIMNRLISFVWMLLLVLLLIILMILQGFGQGIIMYLRPILHLSTVATKVVAEIRIPFIIAVSFIIVILLYYFVPSVKTKIRYTIFGSGISVIGLMILSQAFSLIIEYFFRNITAYKTLGTFIVIMLWLYFIGIVLMFGAVINASVQEYYTGSIESTRGSVRSIITNARKFRSEKKNTTKN